MVGPLDYADTYRRMEASQLTLTSGGIEVISLTDVFNDVPQSVYCDAIHCGWFKGRGEEGYRIMAERIADELARLWNPSAAQHQK